MSIENLSLAENLLETTKGKAFLTERVVMHGKDLHHDLGHKDWFDMHLFAITGRYFSDEALDMLNYVWASTGYPDSSIWPNNTAALAGSVRSTASLAMAAGLINSEATVFGGRPIKKTIDFFLRARKKVEQGVALEKIVEAEIERNGVLFGYGRPLASIDERIPYLLKKATETGFRNGECVEMAIAINNHLVETKKIAMNAVGLVGALGADFGFTPDEFHLFMNLCFYSGQPPCYQDAVEKPMGTFFPIRCDSVRNDKRQRKQWDDS